MWFGGTASELLVQILGINPWTKQTQRTQEQPFNIGFSFAFPLPRDPLSCYLFLPNIFEIEIPEHLFLDMQVIYDVIL